MTGAPSVLADLLAECDAHGIRLLPAGDGGLAIDALQDALTPDLLARLKAHKADVLAMMRPAPDDLTGHNRPPKKETNPPATPVCRCGSAAVRDVLVHGGRSIRRDCGRCGRFIDFPVWNDVKR